MAEDSRPSSSRRTAEFAKRYRLSGGCGVGSGGCGPLPLRFGASPTEKILKVYIRSCAFWCILMAFSCFALGAQWRSQKFVNGQEFGCDQSAAQRPPDVRRREAP